MSSQNHPKIPPFPRPVHLFHPIPSLLRGRRQDGTVDSAGVDRYGGSGVGNGAIAAAAAAGAEQAAGDAALSRRLLPLYLVFVLDAVGLGVALPVLPFFVMGLKATALQLAIVVSSNYIAQTFGEGNRERRGGVKERGE